MASDNAKYKNDLKDSFNAKISGDVSKEALEDFYSKAQTYWANIPPTVNGMLGGLGYVNTIDIQGSENFLKELQVGNECALDCGAGIGRVTKQLLLPRFRVVDLVEQDPLFASKASGYCMQNPITTNRIGQIYNVGLQNFTPFPNKYDLIWAQWVLSHLTDNDLMKFFRGVLHGLKNTGYLILKENVTSTKQIEYDHNDSSVTRPLKLYETILKNAGFRIAKIYRQDNFPKGLYPVYIIASKPIKNV